MCFMVQMLGRVQHKWITHEYIFFILAWFSKWMHHCDKKKMNKINAPVYLYKHLYFVVWPCGGQSQ